jgi:hypothetical protein
MLEIRAEVDGDQGDFHYLWFADTGVCEPQESSRPTTLFQFAEGAARDSVTVEVWHGRKRVAQTRIEVRLSDDSKRLAAKLSEQLQIEITEIPYAERGGPETRTDIAGVVTGKILPEFKVLLYARDEGVWFIQPTSRAIHSISPDGRWSSWTHSGSAYGALVVRSGYASIRTLDALPALGGDVLARTVVDGRKK